MFITMLDHKGFPFFVDPEKVAMIIPENPMRGPAGSVSYSGLSRVVVVGGASQMVRGDPDELRGVVEEALAPAPADPRGFYPGEVVEAPAPEAQPAPEPAVA